jgi:hypothetical protein
MTDNVRAIRTEAWVCTRCEREARSKTLPPGWDPMHFIFENGEYFGFCWLCYAHVKDVAHKAAKKRR